MTVHEAPLDHIVQCHLACEAWFAGNAPLGGHATGDLGDLDVAGRLFVAGRDDEMMIFSGENVLPQPVEEALSYLPQVSEVAVVGVSVPGDVTFLDALPRNATSEIL